MNIITNPFPDAGLAVPWHPYDTAVMGRLRSNNFFNSAKYDSSEKRERTSTRLHLISVLADISYINNTIGYWSYVSSV